MSTMRERMARKLIDIDPSISGYHPVHLELKYPAIDAVLAELENPTPEMIAKAKSILPGFPRDIEIRSAFVAAIKAAKE